MKKTKQNLPQLLLAAAMALPLAAYAAEDAPSAPDFGPRGGPAADGWPGMPPGAEGPRGGRGEGPGREGPGAFGHGHPFLHGLEMTEAQEDKIFTILHGQAPYLREQHKAEEKAMRALHDLRSAEKYDDNAAAKLAQAAAQAHANITLQEIRTHQKVLAVLTPEQRKQLDERKPHAPRP
jgi:Spy/CpxP family protein refolding chaperone